MFRLKQFQDGHSDFHRQQKTAPLLKKSGFNLFYIHFLKERCELLSTNCVQKDISQHPLLHDNLFQPM